MEASAPAPTTKLSIIVSVSVLRGTPAIPTTSASTAQLAMAMINRLVCVCVQGVWSSFLGAVWRGWSVGSLLAMTIGKGGVGVGLDTMRKVGKVVESVRRFPNAPNSQALMLSGRSALARMRVCTSSITDAKPALSIKSGAREHAGVWLATT